MLIALLLTALLGAERVPEEAPRLAVPAPIHELGTILKGESVNHRFEIRNQGTAPLRLAKPKPSCGCLSVTYSQTIDPGEVGSIAASWDSARFSPGPFELKINVATNDPDQSERTLRITGKLTEPLMVRPQRVRIVGTTGRPLAASIEFYAGTEQPIEIIAVSSSGPEVEVGTPTETRTADHTRVIGYQLSVGPSRNASRHTESLEVRYRIGDSAPQSRQIHVEIERKPVITCTPGGAIYLRTDPEQGKTSADIMVRSADPKLAFEITHAELVGRDSNAFELDFTPATSGPEHAVTIRLASSQIGRLRKARIVVHTNSPDHPKCEIRVYGK